MIASENFAPLAVMAAQGSVLTNKYAEGYPGRRYYGGCEHVDVVEQLAIDRLKALFGAEYANVQPHSGAQANAAAMAALLHPGETDPRPRPRARRPPHPRHAAQLLRPALPDRGVPRPRGRPPRGHGRGGAAGTRAAAEGDHRRVVGLPAPPRLRGVPSDRRRRRRLSDGGHGALRRAGRRRAAPVAAAARARGHLDHAQDARWAARRGHPGGERRARPAQEAQLQRLPGPAGRPAGARDRREGGGVQDRRGRGVPRPAGADARGRPPARRPPARRRLPRRGDRRGQRRHRRAPGPGGPAGLGAGREAGGGSPAPGRHHGQPQRRALRPPPPDDQLRGPDRDPGAGRPRLRPEPSSPRSPTSSPRPCARRPTRPRWTRCATA